MQADCNLKVLKQQFLVQQLWGCCVRARLGGAEIGWSSAAFHLLIQASQAVVQSRLLPREVLVGCCQGLALSLPTRYPSLEVLDAPGRLLLALHFCLELVQLLDRLSQILINLPRFHTV